jgi:response regulator RpfG family c-di-GMP phosphodiesterase
MSRAGATPAKDTVDSLRARLAELEREAAARQSQLEHYAADLREVFKHERERARELRRSYRATVLALADAVEARDAYTGKHAQRVAAYGLRVAHAAGIEVDPQIEFGFLLHDIGKLSVPRRAAVQARAAVGRGARACAPAPRGRRGDPASHRLPR